MKRNSTSAKAVKDPTAHFSLAHKFVAVALSVVMLGFGWPAVNPAEALAAKDKKSTTTEVQAEETTVDSSASSSTAQEEASTASDSEQSSASQQPATDQSSGQSSDQSSQSSSTPATANESTATADSSSQKSSTEEETEKQYDVKLVLNNAYIVKEDGQSVSAPSSKITLPTGQDFKFSVKTDSSYKLDKVLMTVSGLEIELKADVSGIYTLTADNITSNTTIKLVTSKDKSSKASVSKAQPIATINDTSADSTSNSAASTSTDTQEDTEYEKWITVGEELSITGSSSFGYGSWHYWYSSDSSIATVSGSDKTATVKGVKTGETTVTHTYGSGWSQKSETYTIHIVAAKPVTSITINGDDTVTQFSTTTLSATLTPAVKATVQWSSSNEDILTVDSSGKVTGLRQGTAEVVATVANADGSVVTASKQIEVVAAETSTDEAIVYYVKSPTSDPNSNDTGEWGPAYGTVKLNTTNATWTDDKNCFDNVDQRVVSWQDGSKGSTYTVPRTDSAWTEIFNSYKSTIEKQLGVEITENDIETIYLTPAKISKNNGSNPDMHLDCSVGVVAKNVAIAKYYLRDAGSTQFTQLGAKTYIVGNQTQVSDVYDKSIPETKVVGTVTYTFSGWYTDHTFTQPATFPYTLNASTDFYAKYVGGYQVKYDLAGGTWGSSDALMYTVAEGSSHTVKKEPTRQGYKFTGWTITGVDGKTTINSGESFTMPSGNVTITANWQQLETITVKYLESGTSNELASSVVRYGEAGQKITEDAVSVDGYHVVGSSTQEQTFGESKELIFYYAKDSVDYTVNYYLNGTSTSIAPSETKQAAWGSSVSVSDVAKSISGYTLVPNQSSSIVINRDGSNTIDVYYYQNVALTANSDTKTYNGQEQSVSGFTGAPSDADFSAISVGASGTDANTYPANFPSGTVGTVDGSGKYIVTQATNGSLTINKVTDKVVVKIKGNTDSQKYNGSEQSVEGYTVQSIKVDGKDTTLYTEGDFSFSGNKVAKGTNAGTYDMNLDKNQFTNSNTNFTNVEFEVEDGQLEITKRNVVLSSESDSKIYDGTTLQKRTDVTVGGDGFVGTDGVLSKDSLVWYDTNNILPGTYENKFDPAYTNGTNLSNYNVELQFGELTVNVRPDSQKYDVNVVANSVTTTYDGGSHTASGLVTSTYTNDKGVTYTLVAKTSNPVAKDAGSYDNNILGSVKVYDPNNNDVTNQFNVSTANGKLVINPRALKLTSVTDTKEYDGTPLTNDQVMVSDGSFVDGEGATYYVTGSQVDPGSSKNAFTYELNEGTLAKNYTITKDEGTLTVTNRKVKYEITVKANSSTDNTYDGTEKSVSGLESDTFVVDGNTYTVSGLTTSDPKKTDAGTYTNAITGTAKVTDAYGNDVTSEFKVNTENGTLKIAQREVEVTSGSAEQVYNGSALTKQEATVTKGSFVEGEEPTYSYSGSQTDVGTSENFFSVNFKKSVNTNNYKVTIKNGTLKVTPNEEKVVVTITEHGGSYTYDGTEKTVSGYDVATSNSLYTANDFTFNGDATVKGTNAGTYAMNLVPGNFTNASKNFSNVEFKIVDATLNIAKRSVTLTSATDSKTYDGTALTNGSVTVGGDGFLNGDGATFDVTGSQLNAGTSSNAFTYTLTGKATEGENGNYIITKDEGTLTVNPITSEVVVTITGYKGGTKYSGDEQSVSGYDTQINGALYTTKDFTFNGEATVKGTNAGTYQMGLNSTQFKNNSGNFTNVTFVVNDGTLTIAQREVTLTSGSAEREYNGEPLTNGTVTVGGDGFVKSEGATYNVTGSQTLVGTSGNTFSYTLTGGATEGVNGNYVITKKEGTLNVINRVAPYTIKVKANSASATYDGTVHSATGLETNEFWVEGNKYTVEGLTTENPSQTDAGTYTNNISGTAVVKDENGKDVTKQFKVSFEHGSLNIAKADLTLKSGSAERAYNGSALTNTEVEATGFAQGEGATYDVTGTITNVGEVTNAFGYTLNANTKASNYNIKKEEGKLKVTPVSDTVVVKIKENSKSYVYDGTVKTASGYTVESISNDLYKESDFSFTGDVAHQSASAKEVGKYDLTIIPSDFTNKSANFSTVSFEIVDGQLEITPADINDYVTLNTTDVEETYDGKPHVAGTATATDKNGNELKIEYQKTDGSWTENPADITAKNVADSTTVNVRVSATNGNYTGYVYGSENLTINKRTVKLTSASDTKVYDGNALTNNKVTVGGEGFAEGEGALYNVTGSQTNVGESKNVFTYELINGATEGDSGNYIIEKEEGTLSVTADANEVVVKITGKTSNVSYDGTTHTVEGYTVNISGGNGNFKVSDVAYKGGTTVSGKDAGTYAMNLDVNNFSSTNGNFSNVRFILESDGSLVVSPREVTLTSEDGSWPYTGATYSKPDVTVSDTVFASEVSDVKATATVTNAGDKKINTITWTPGAQYKESNYTINKSEGTLEVTKGKISDYVTLNTADVVATYDGTSHATGVATATDKNNNQLTIEYQKADGSWTQNPADITAKNVSDSFTVNVRVSADNYEGYLEGKQVLTINKRVVNLESGSAEKVWDGTALTKPGVTGTEMSGNTGFVTGEASAEAVGTITDYAQYGTAGITPNTIQVNWVNGVDQNNYDVKTTEGTLKITRRSAEKEIHVYGSDKTYTYDTSAHPAGTATASAVVGESTINANVQYRYNGGEWTNSPNSITLTNVADGPITIEIRAWADNFEGYAYGSETLAITPLTVKYQTGSKTKVYDGSALTFAKGEANSYWTSEGSIYANDYSVFVNDMYTTGTQTNVGTADNPLTIEYKTGAQAEKIAKNYNIVLPQTGEVGMGLLTVTGQSINPNDPSSYKGVTVNSPVDVTYDGATHQWKPEVKDANNVALTEGKDYTVNYSTTDFTNVTGEITVTITGTGNYTGTVTRTYKINPVSVTVNTESATKAYDGTALTAPGSINGLVNGETATVATTNSQTEVGSKANDKYVINWGTAKQDNYVVSEGTLGNLTVTKQSIVNDPSDPGSYKGVKINDPVSVVYDGKDHTWTPTVTDANNNPLVQGADYTLTYDTNNFTDAKTITVTIEGIGNYKGKATKTYQITPAPLTVTTGSKDKVYDNTPLTYDNASVEGLVNGESVEIHATGTQTEVGSSTNGYEITWTGAKDSNYSITKENLGTLTVNQYADQITVTVTGGTFTYDGTAHGATVGVSTLPAGYSVQTASSNASATDVNGKGITANADNLVIVNAQGVDVTKDLKINYVSGTVKVVPATLTVKTPNAEKQYDGKALTSAGTIEGFVKGETATFATTGSQTNVGSSTNTYSINWTGTAKQANYTISETLGTLEVTNNTTKIDVTAGSAEKTYDGTALTSSDVKVSGLPEGFTYTTKTEGSQTDAGTGTNTVTEFKIFDPSGKDVTEYFTNIETHTGELKVNKRNITLTSSDASKTYDGTALTKNEVKLTAGSFVGSQSFSATTTGTITNVGSTNNTFDYELTNGAKADNYNVTVVEGVLSVSKAPLDKSLTLTTNAAEKTYDGKALEANKATATGLPEGNVVKIEYSTDGINWTEDPSDLYITNFSESTTVQVRATSSANYEGTVTGTASLTITKRPVELTSEGGSKVYDGTALTKPDVTGWEQSGNTGFVTGEVTNVRATGSVTKVEEGTVTNTIAYDTASSFNANNYTIKTTEGKLSIAAQSITPDTPTYGGVEINTPKNVTYNGDEHKWSPTVTDKDGKPLTEGKDYTVTYNTDDFTNVSDTITVTITGTGDYTGTVTKTYQITPAKLTVTTPSAEKVYDGTALTAPATAENLQGLVKSETATVKVSGSQIAVGSSKNTYDGIEWGTAKASNYEVASITEGTLTVKQSAEEIVVTVTGGEFTYDGTEHKATVSVSTLPKGYVLETATSDAKATDANGKGIYANVDHLVIKNAQGVDVTDSLNITRKSDTLKVKPATLTVVTPSANKQYDGKALTASGTISGFVNGETADFATTGSQTNVGKSTNGYSINWTGTANKDNYTISETLGNLEVTNNTTKIDVTAGSAEKTYDGTALTSNDVTVSGLPEGFTYSTVTDGNQTDAGTGTNTVTEFKIFDPSGNDVTKYFTGVEKYTGTLKIDKRVVNLKSEGGSKVYDGTALTKPDVTGWQQSGNTGFLTNEVSNVRATGSVTNVSEGEVTNAIAYDTASGFNANNYTITKDEGKLSIVAQSLVPDTPTYGGVEINTPENVTYNGDEHKWSPTVTDKDGKPLTEGKDYTVTYNTDDFTNAGGTITVTITGKGDYTGTVTKTYQITPAKLTVTTPSAEKVYDGTALTAPATAENLKGLAKNETATVKVSGSQTAVGSSKNTYAGIEWGTAKASNYEVASVTEGTLTVKQSAEEIVVTVTGGTFTYDGTSHGATVEVGTLPTGYSVQTAESSATVTNVAEGVVEATADKLVIVNAQGEDVTDTLSITMIPGTLEVTPAPLVITTGSATKTYDGSALTNSELSIDGLKGADSVTARTTGEQTTVGSSTNTYRIDWGKVDPANYTITETLGTLTVTAAPATVVPGTTPTATPTTPTGTGTGATGPVASVAETLENGYEAVTGNNAEEQIYDEETPLGRAFDTCWVHFYMIICMLITAMYAAGVWIRRGNHTHKLKKDMNNIMGGGNNGPENDPVATTDPSMEA